MVVSAANSAARKRPRTPDVTPRAAGDQPVHAAPRAAGSGPQAPEHRSEVRADADASLTAVNLDDTDPENDGDLETADLEDFGELEDADDVDLQAVLADADLEEPDIADVAITEDLVGDEVDVPDGVDGGSGPDRP